MLRICLLLLLSGCASVASETGNDDGGGGELGGPAADLASMPGPGADLLGGGDQGQASGYPYPRVNEVVPSAGGVAADEFVEIIGADHDINLSGWVLHQETSGGTLRPLLSLGSLPLPRGGYVVIAADKGRFAAMADQTYVSSTMGEIAQVGGAIALFDPGGKRVDSLGWGTAKGAYVEGQAAPDPGDLSASRIPDGADTDNNRSDVKKAAITPRAANHL